MAGRRVVGLPLSPTREPAVLVNASLLRVLVARINVTGDISSYESLVEL